MAEYRRFIAYFYEYIDGKRQKNSGFAKVELRNGMWRLLFRLNQGEMLEQPIQVYGFVRENPYLLGIPMGTIRPDRQNMEEWAYRAQTPVGESSHSLEDFSGIRIEDGAGRCFFTVWDDEPLDPEKFVLSIPEPEVIAEPETEELIEEEAEEVAEPEKQIEEEAEEVAEAAEPEELIVEAEEAVAEQEELIVEEAEAVSEPEELVEEAEEEVTEAAEPEEPVEEAEEAAAEPEQITAEELPEQQDAILELFQSRSHFEPFADAELSDCVMIQPCDVVRLQQERWQVGRSSFLQHGFYQHRHLLLGMMEDGAYVIGVPGVQNPQEQYMARLFGFEHFKPAQKLECGKTFGYWCSKLQKYD